MEYITVNEKIYTVEALLGRGKGGYSYLVTDGAAEYVCKQIHHEPCDYYTFGDKLASELRDYERLRELGLPLPRLLDVDREGERLLKEYIPGPTAERLRDAGALPPGWEARLEEMCALLYPAGLNIDWYPTNFIWWRERLWYIDYECNPYDPQWDLEHWGRQYWHSGTNE